MDEQEMTQPVQSQPAPEKKGYGKRPPWHWIVIYLIIGGIIYFVIYFFLKGAANLLGY